MHRALLRAVLAFLTLAGTYTQVSAAVISVTPENQTVTVGSSLLVSVTIQDLIDGGAPSLGAFDLDLSYDSNMLGFSSVTFGTGLDVLGLGSLAVSDSSVGGILNVAEVSFDLPEDLHLLQPGAFTLFTVTFEALSTGVSALSLEVNSLADAYAGALDATTIDASVTAVPLPAAAWLFLSGVIGLVSVARRRTN